MVLLLEELPVDFPEQPLPDAIAEDFFKISIYKNPTAEEGAFSEIISEKNQSSSVASTIERENKDVFSELKKKMNQSKKGLRKQIIKLNVLFTLFVVSVCVICSNLFFANFNDNSSSFDQTLVNYLIDFQKSMTRIFGVSLASDFYSKFKADQSFFPKQTKQLYKSPGISPYFDSKKEDLITFLSDSTSIEARASSNSENSSPPNQMSVDYSEDSEKDNLQFLEHKKQKLTKDFFDKIKVFATSSTFLTQNFKSILLKAIYKGYHWHFEDSCLLKMNFNEFNKNICSRNDNRLFLPSLLYSLGKIATINMSLLLDFVETMDEATINHMNSSLNTFNGSTNKLIILGSVN